MRYTRTHDTLFEPNSRAKKVAHHQDITIAEKYGTVLRIRTGVVTVHYMTKYGVYTYTYIMLTVLEI